MVPRLPLRIIRPNAIGLSVAEVIRVESGRLVLGGADIVDGSPVLDIKPYVPFCDGCPAAHAPPWVQVGFPPPSGFPCCLSGSPIMPPSTSAWRNSQTAPRTRAAYLGSLPPIPHQVEASEEPLHIDQVILLYRIC